MGVLFVVFMLAFPDSTTAGDTGLKMMYAFGIPFFAWIGWVKWQERRASK